MAMYFVQHGLALAKEVDSDRPLSVEGRTQIERISAHLKHKGVSVYKICHSGKTRAKETAQLFADQIGDSRVVELYGMEPNDNVMEFAKTLTEEDVMYVGHLPHMGKLVSYLITGDENRDIVQFRNGGVVCVQKENAGFHIEWYLTPSMC